MRILIIDGYTDEPAGLGVPPYIDVYPRYIAGAAWLADPYADVHYITVDAARRDPDRVSNESTSSELTVLVAGVTVPGKYLGGAPATLNDALSLPRFIRSKFKAICGPAVRFGFGKGGGSRTRRLDDLGSFYDFVITGDPETVILDLLKNGFDAGTDTDSVRESEDVVNKFAVRGARIIKQHPLYPEGLICEIETYRGCPRSLSGGCSFCTEPLHGIPDFRSVKGIAYETGALNDAGAVNFRLGRQPDLLVYGSMDRDSAMPEPNPPKVKRLFSAVRRSAPSLRVLHIDNVNPATVFNHPVASKEALRAIVQNHTSGDVAALGIESVDDEVIRRNNLKVNYEGAMFAIELINKVGGERGENGLPQLLPGVNFVYGLQGETDKTFEINLEFMKDVLNSGLMVRRINLRQVMIMPYTRMEAAGDFLVRSHKSLFIKHKLRMRHEVDLPMLKRVMPPWTILRSVRTEQMEGHIVWSRQIGSYPILIGIHKAMPLGIFTDVTVISHGSRSVSALPLPLRINLMSIRELEAIPGIGSKRAASLVLARPFADAEELRSALDDPDILEPLIPMMDFSLRTTL